VRYASIAFALGCATVIVGPVHAAKPATAKPATAKPAMAKHVKAKPAMAKHVKAKHAKAKPAKAKPAKAKHAKALRKRVQHRAKRTPSSTAAHITTPDQVNDEVKAAPAVRYGQLSRADCEAELARRHIDFVRETGDAVLAPVRLTGPLRGVVFRSNARDKDRPTSPYEIADCRLVLALDDFAEILSRHEIVEVRHYSMYRPPRSWPGGEIGTRHAGALAIDAGRFIDRSGAVLDVDRDFHGAIDAPTCGDRAAPKPATAAAVTLRAILCEAVEHRLFNVVLTPNYNRPHKNHFHLEVTAGVAWFLVH
jgi:hypothetical protein